MQRSRYRSRRLLVCTWKLLITDDVDLFDMVNYVQQDMMWTQLTWSIVIIKIQKAQML
jgi:hypothetical protein